MRFLEGHHFYYSKEQEKTIDDLSALNRHNSDYRCYAIVNGEEVLYTECSESIIDHHVRFEDSVYLGVGKYSRTGERYGGDSHG